jgi:hypothetical protein
MKRSYLTNLLLIALIIGLYWFNNTGRSKNEMAQLTTLMSSEIQYIAISRPGETDIELQKLASSWHIIKPIKAVANNKRIELLLSFLDTPSYAQIKVADDTMFTQFELKPANIVLTLNKHSMQFGGIESISKHRYVLSDHVIHLITDRITPLLRVNATSFIENRLIPKQNIISKLVLPWLDNDNRVSTESVIIENNNGHWQSNIPTITTDQLTQLVEKWQYAYALKVHPLRDNYQANAKAYPVQIWFNNEKYAAEYSLTLNNNTLFIIAPLQQLNYQFTAASLSQLLPSQHLQQ